MDKLTEILENVLLAHHDDLSMNDDYHIAQAHAQILELMGMGEAEIRNTLGGLMSKENLCFQITGGHPQDMLNYVAHALHTAWEEKLRGER